MDEEAKQRILDLAQQQRWKEVRAAVADWPTQDVADLLLELDAPLAVLLFRTLPRAVSAEAFTYLEADQQEELLHALTDAETRHVLDAMSPDDRTALLEELPAEATRRLLTLLDPEELAEARKLLGYPEESVGRLMTPDYVDVRKTWTVQQALDHIRRHGKDKETVNRVYVTDERGRLLDDVRLRHIILAQPDQVIQDLMDEQFVSLSPFEDREEAVRVMRRYDLFALPVADADGVLLGLVTSDDVLDVAEEEATEDIHKVGSVVPLRQSYRRANVGLLYRKRVFWLSALVVVSLGSSGVIAYYEETLANHVALAFFIPLLIATGGNTGSQSATLLIRALATDDIQMSEWAGAFFKEIAVGASLGVTLGIFALALGLLRADWRIGLIVGLTMVSIVVLSNLIGMALPFILGRIKIDPATASTPFITTILDALGLLIYFSIAVWILATM